MISFKNQKWHEPQQNQFLRYLRENKVLETIQPALTLMHGLPVQPSDLFTFFAEYLENGAKSNVQISLLNAELCFKQNELQELLAIANIENSEEPELQDPVKVAPTIKNMEGQEKPDENDNELSPVASHHSITSSDKEMDSILQFIGEYQEIDPFGILFDFGPRESTLLALEKLPENFYTRKRAHKLDIEKCGEKRGLKQNSLSIVHEEEEATQVFTPKYDKLNSGLRRMQQIKMGMDSSGGGNGRSTEKEDIQISVAVAGDGPTTD